MSFFKAKSSRRVPVLGVAKTQRTHAIHDAGLKLLATRDHPELSVDDVVEAAGSSKGAFYLRWPDGKSQFLDDIVDFKLALEAAKLRTALDAAKWQDAPPMEVLRGVVAAIVEAIGPDGASGALRCGEARMATSPVTAKAVQAFRRTVIDTATAILMQHISLPGDGPEWACRFAARSAFSIALDASYHRDGPFAPNSQSLVDAIVAQESVYLDLPDGYGAEGVAPSNVDLVEPPSVQWRDAAKEPEIAVRDSRYLPRI